MSIYVKTFSIVKKIDYLRFKIRLRTIEMNKKKIEIIKY